VIAVNPFGGVTVQGYSSTNPNATHGIAVRGNSMYANTLVAASRGLGITLIGEPNITLPNDPPGRRRRPQRAAELPRAHLGVLPGIERRREVGSPDDHKTGTKKSHRRLTGNHHDCEGVVAP